MAEESSKEYEDESEEDLIENDEVSPEEDAFIRGYNKAEEEAMEEGESEESEDEPPD